MKIITSYYLQCHFGDWKDQLLIACHYSFYFLSQQIVPLPLFTSDNTFVEWKNLQVRNYIKSFFSNFTVKTDKRDECVTEAIKTE